MKWYFALWLNLFAAGYRRAGGSRPARPDADKILWLHAGAGTSRAALAQLAQRILRAMRLNGDRIGFVFTIDGDAPGDAAGFPPLSTEAKVATDSLPDLRGFLDHFRPDAAILCGGRLAAPAIVAASDRDIPLILAEARVTAADWRRWRRYGQMTASLLNRFSAILAQDPLSARLIGRIAGPDVLVDVAGRIEETTDPLPCNEVERGALAELIRARPAWLAVACPEAEEAAIIATQTRALQLAHRMLLIVVPEDAARGPALAARLADAGFEVALRSRDEEPEANIQIFVADSEGELGLWYRLAPVTYMGGSLRPGSGGRSPFEPAALGSAILHGPHLAPYENAYARLDEAQAARRVTGAAGLSEAVGDLIAADKAATLAHNAWQVSSHGAEVAERVTRRLTEALARPAVRPAAEAK